MKRMSHLSGLRHRRKTKTGQISNSQHCQMEFHASFQVMPSPYLCTWALSMERTGLRRQDAPEKAGHALQCLAIAFHSNYQTHSRTRFKNQQQYRSSPLLVSTFMFQGLLGSCFINLEAFYKSDITIISSKQVIKHMHLQHAYGAVFYIVWADLKNQAKWKSRNIWEPALAPSLHTGRPYDRL